MKKINHLKKLLSGVDLDSVYYCSIENKIYGVYKINFIDWILFDGKNLYREASLVIYLSIINNDGCFL